MEASDFSSQHLCTNQKIVDHNSEAASLKQDVNEGIKEESNKKIRSIATSNLSSNNHSEPKRLDVNSAAIKIQQVVRGLTARHQLIQKYVEKHFKCISNVPLVSQAKVIYLGEIHTDVRGLAVTHKYQIKI